MRSKQSRAADDRVRLKRFRFKDILKPLSIRERLIYGAILIFLLVVMLGQATSARDDRFGRIVQIPARQCVAEEGWFGPEQASGQPAIGSAYVSTPLDSSNSAVSESLGSLVCSAFEFKNDVRVETALTIYAATDTASLDQPLPSEEELSLTTPELASTELNERQPVIDADLAGGGQTTLDQILDVELSIDEGQVWQSIAHLSSDDLAENPSETSIRLPAEYSTNYDKLLVRLTPLQAGSEAPTILVDSVSLTYKVGSAKELRLRPNGEEALDDQTQWSLPNSTEFDFELVVHDPNVNLLEGVTRELANSLTSAEDPQLEANFELLSNQDGKVTQLQTEETEFKDNSITGDDVWDVKLKMPPSLDPGSYTLNTTVILEDGSTASYTQDFLWGVLAMNFSASSYEPGQTADIAMAVLDERGFSVCDAQLGLEVYLGEQLVIRHSTSDGSINVAETCEEYLANLPPDYSAEFTPQIPGIYDVILTAKTDNGTYQLTDRIISEVNPEFLVERQGPTRIYPIFSSNMLITVSSRSGGQYILTETVPDSFDISGTTFATNPSNIVTNSDGTKSIIWNLALRADTPTTLGYVFDAPDISPEFYLLGPAVLSDSTNPEVFSEPRNWQIASDAVGDIAAYLETTGQEAITTTPLTLDWTSTTVENAGFSINGANTLVDLTDGGHYFVTYSSGFESTSGSNRSEVQTNIDVAGTNLDYGRSTCYIRRANGINECWSSGSAIIDATAGDDLSIEAFRTDSNAGAGVRRIANDSGLALVKLDDNWDYARISETSGGQTFNSSTFESVLWDTQDELDSGSFTHSTVSNTDQIELEANGEYLVTANMMFRASSSARRGNEIRLTLNGTEIEGTRTSSYIRGSNSTQDHTAQWVGVISASANDILRLQGRCEGANCGNITNVGNQTAISIVKLPSTTNSFQIHESGGGQAVDSTATPVDFDTNVQLDSDFSHSTSTNPSRVTVNTADDYLFFGSFYSDRSGSSSNARHQPHWEWRLNGSTVQNYGSFAKINRGNSNGNRTSGDAGAILMYNMSLNDYIELINTDESTATDAQNTFVGDRYGMSGLNITSLFITDPFTEQLHFRWRDDSTALNTAGGWLATEDNNSIGDRTKGDQLRIRMEVANSGSSAESSARQYELEFAEKGGTTCSTATGWTGVADSTADAIGMFNTTQYANDASVTPGLLTNSESYSFTSGRAQDNGDDTTLSIGPIASGGYTELEYAIQIDDAAVTGKTYCFRLYDSLNSSVLDSYGAFPEVTLGENLISSPSGLGEAGTFTAPADGGWATVNFQGSYTSPVVVGISNSHNAENALVFEARNVTSTSAQMRLCESEGSTSSGCDTHAAETGGYLVIDEAVADTTDGIEAGSFSISGGENGSVTTTYDTAFTTSPYVFANVNTVNDTDVPTEVVIRSVGTASFNANLCQHLIGSDDVCDTTHSSETVGWVALEPGNEPFTEQFQHNSQSIDTDGGSWVSVVFSPSFTSTPAFLGASQTDGGGQDPEIDNARLVTTTGADIRFCEMDATDTCDSHAADTFAWLAIEETELQTTYSLDQDTYRFYQNTNAVQPTTPLAAENTPFTGGGPGGIGRLRLAAQAGEEDLPALAQDFKLQFGRRDTTCSAISNWTDFGDLSSSAAWRGYNNSTPADGANITASLLNGGSNQLMSYVEENDSPNNPNAITEGQRGEWDWVIQINAATEGTAYCFRMVASDGDPIYYSRYPIVTTAGTNEIPSNPASLAQTKTDDTNLAVGDWTNETSVKFTANVSDTDPVDTLQLCVEVKEIGTAFTNTEDGCGDVVTYTGTAVAANVTLPGFTDTDSYHWQARVLDGGGLYSSWVSFGGNPEANADFSVDTADPSGTVYDGTTVGVDADFNSGSLSELSANWSFTDASSGMANYDYSIGSTPGATDIYAWTDHNLLTSVTQGTLTLNTGAIYYFNIRGTDEAGNSAIVSSDGQFVAPTLSFSTSPGSVEFGELNAGNSYTSTKDTTLTTSTNAYGGYIIRAFTGGLLTNQLGDTIGFFDGGTYVAPDGWLGGDRGYGYTSSDNDIQGVNLFSPATCLGGNPSPCYAPFSLTGPGDIVADHTAAVVGSPIVNENFIITHRVTSDSLQEAGTYTSEIIYSVIPKY